MTKSYLPNQFDIQDRYYGDSQGFGGQYVPEILIPSLDELDSAFQKYRNDSEFLRELKELQHNFIGRPSPLIYAKRLTEKLGGAKIYLKNEGNNLTGSHKINHCIYQALLAQRMGKKRVICETGAGQHGIATATVSAKFGLECIVYMGQKDIDSQYPNVFFMKQMGATVVPVKTGNQRLVEAVDAALGDFLKNPDY
jgi:tryptophan synthase beta chain